MFPPSPQAPPSPPFNPPPPSSPPPIDDVSISMPPQNQQKKETYTPSQIFNHKASKVNALFVVAVVAIFLPILIQPDSEYARKHTKPITFIIQLNFLYNFFHYILLELAPKVNEWFFTEFFSFFSQLIALAISCNLLGLFAPTLGYTYLSLGASYGVIKFIFLLIVKLREKKKKEEGNGMV